MHLYNLAMPAWHKGHERVLWYQTDFAIAQAAVPAILIAWVSTCADYKYAQCTQHVFSCPYLPYLNICHISISRTRTTIIVCSRSVLAHIHRVGQYPSRLCLYKKYLNEFNIIDIQFPLKHTDVPKFEQINPSLSVNVLVNENKEVFPLYASKHRDRPHHLNVLMIANGVGKCHYFLVRDVKTRCRPY